jgi:putative transposase
VGIPERRSTVVRNRIDALEDFRKQLEGADVDLLREMVKVFAEQLMGADADVLCGADYGERSPERVNRRNGYRERAWDTRAGTIALAVPKLREGTYFPEWLLEPRRRAERAFVQVVAECYVRGVSTRRVEGLVAQLGIERISRSRVSEMAKGLDEAVEAFRTRPLDGGPTPTSGSTRSPRRSERTGGSGTSPPCSPPASTPPGSERSWAWTW